MGFHNADGTGLSLVGQCAAAGQLLELLVELEAVIAGLGTEDAAAAREQGRLDAARTGTAGAFLTLELARRAGDFVALLRLVRALTLVSEILLHVEVDSVVISLHAENGIRKDYLTTRFFSLCVQYS